MAITDYKITDGEITQRNVKSAPDVLSNTPNNNKAVFDNLTEHFIGKYNDLIDNINSDFVDSSEFAEGLTVSDKVRWRYALTKGASIGLNFSGNITQITTGFRTIVGDIDGLTETDFMDCYLSINGTDYECGDSYTSGNSILTSAEINGVTVEIIYDTTNGNITLEHATNPLDTFYWNVSIYRSVAEKVPRKALPASVSNDGYTELMATGKWHGVELNKTEWLSLETTSVTVVNFSSNVYFAYTPSINGPITANQTALDTTEKNIAPNVKARLLVDSSGKPVAIRFSNTSGSVVNVDIAYYTNSTSGAKLPIITSDSTAYEINTESLVQDLFAPTVITPTVKSSFTVTNTSGVSCIKAGRLCIIRFAGHLTSSLSADGVVTIMELPIDVFPANGNDVDLSLASGREVYATVINDHVNINVKNIGSSAIATTTYFGVNTVYITV